MATLANLHTGNPTPHPGLRAGFLYLPYELASRHRLLQHRLHHSGDYNVVNHVPLAPVQPMVDPLLDTGRAAPDPSYVERVSTHLTRDNYVATLPRTHLREAGDTAEHKMLIRSNTCVVNRLRNWWHGSGGRRTVAGLNTYSRYHPYLGR